MRGRQQGRLCPAGFQGRQKGRPGAPVRAQVSKQRMSLKCTSSAVPIGSAALPGVVVRLGCKPWQQARPDPGDVGVRICA